jgi:PKHD-type hydroxylase
MGLALQWLLFFVTQNSMAPSVNVVDGFLSPLEVIELQTLMRSASCVDGAGTAGRWAEPVKRNNQVVSESIVAAGEGIVSKLFESRPVASVAYPYRAIHPMFLQYNQGDFYGRHEDNPLQAGMRADLSYTLFLSEPDEYEGGDLVLGKTGYRLSAGTLLLYDAGLPHEVTPVTAGVRLVAVGWVQSVVRAPENRSLLRRFFAALEPLSHEMGLSHPSFMELNAIRNDLMRRWAEI